MQIFSGFVRILYILCITALTCFSSANAVTCLSKQINTGTECIDTKFTLTTLERVSDFDFLISAAGTFYVDCGDGGQLLDVRTETSLANNTITRPDADGKPDFYVCHYTNDNGNPHIIRFGGAATGYNSSEPAISFEGRPVAAIYGSLGAIFGTISNPTVGLPDPLFPRTFADTTLTTIPENLFSGVTNIAPNMFVETFDASDLTTVPLHLFDGLSGNMNTEDLYFAATFRGNRSLSYLSDNGTLIPYIPSTFLNNISGTGDHSAVSMFGGTNLLDECPVGMYNIPNALFLLSIEKPVCGTIDVTDNMPFSMVTLGDIDSFNFVIDATGTFYVDWGDGEFETIENQDYDNSIKVSHRFNNSYSGNRIIRLGGHATGYGFSNMQSIGNFNAPILGISGSLGAIFGTISNPTNGISQPYFRRTFFNHPITTIPENLFDGIYGKPIDSMFDGTFAGTAITSIPENLFAGLSMNSSDELPNNVFNGTFAGCQNLTSVPLHLFDNIIGRAGGGRYGLGLFEITFADSPITEITDDKKSTPYVPVNFLPGLENDSTENANITRNMFNNTELLDQCPSGTINVTKGFFGKAGKPMCGVFEMGTPFKITTTSDTSTFRIGTFYSGHFFVDWGDGSSIEELDLPTLWSPNADIQHNYTTPGSYTIKLYGRATGYFDVGEDTPIRFYPRENIKSVSGSLGNIFPTLGNGSNPDTQQPKFGALFRDAINLTSIPSNLFDGVTGDVAPWMFWRTFSGSGITSIPENLFAALSGTPQEFAFIGTFEGCSALSSIPGNLFATLSGTPQESAFSGTFEGCSELSSIPGNLFATLSGTLMPNVFNATFASSGITQIPSNLFRNFVSKPLAETINDNNWYEDIMSHPDRYEGEFGPFVRTFADTPITSIPNGLFDGVSGVASFSMFTGTFEECQNLTTVPVNLFNKISGVAEPFAFNNTFRNCSNLTGFTDGTTTTTSYVPSTFLSNITDNTSVSNQATNMFNGTGLASTCPAGTYDVTRQQFNDAGSPWCVEINKFTLTTNSTNSFQFKLSAAGNFMVDCGNGGTLSGTGVSGIAITRNNNTDATYTCSWSSSAAQTIRFGGLATGYSTDSYTPAISFNTDTTNAKKITGISGSLGQIFPTLSNPTVGTSQPRFRGTFSNASNMLNTNIDDPNNPGKKYALPPTLFDGVSGAPADYMFAETFFGCSNLTGSIPANLFAGISGAPADYMFAETFFGCDGLTGSIPEDLFAGISGAPAESMFDSTFSECRNLIGSIPANLFAGISGAPAVAMFGSTFTHCSNLTGSIPANLFAGISGAPAVAMFHRTFGGCSNLTGSIPANLFAGISGAPASDMFASTFSDCSNLTGSIPANLFAGISGAPASYMFASTFSGCSNLTGSIPANLFAGISGAPAGGMFSGTFLACSNLTGSIPANLFAGISGAPAEGMFESTFNGCSNLTGFTDGTITTSYVPSTFLSSITDNTSVSNQATNMFNGTGLASTCPAGTYDVTRQQFNDAGSPWCEEINKFTLTTNSTNSFQFKLSAAGNFVVDCGNGGTLSGTGVSGIAITRNNNTDATYTCSWGSSAAQTIRFGGLATGYSTDSYTPAISFNTDTTNAKKITGISGSLGQIFPTLSNTTVGTGQPRFSGTFSNASNMLNTNIDDPNNPGKKYALPPTLFDGVTGAPASNMFESTFYGCSNLTGSIPANLFAGISGAPAEGMFYGTFSKCSNLTGSIPENLFAGISGAPASLMFAETFRYCSNLTGSIPANLFAGISGAPVKGMFAGTFFGCDGLTGFTDGTTTTSYVPSTFLSNITDDISMSATNMFNGTGLASTCPVGTYDVTRQQFNDAGSPWCEETYKFTLTTNSTNSFKFKLSAAGDFMVDCGNGGTLSGDGVFGNTITRTGTSPVTYTCSWPSSTVQTVRFDGQATGYNTSSNTASIRFNIDGSSDSNVKKVTSIFGSLGQIFGTVANPSTGQSQPRFYSTFWNATNLKGSIPSTLFDGITGAPASYMFYGTFNGCSNLTGFTDGTITTSYVPSTFLSSITDNTSVSNQATNMFNGTGLASTCPAGTYDVTRQQFNDAGSPWCEEINKFTLTTNSTNSFQFKLSAAGNFVVDCGNGGTLSGTGVSGNAITRNDNTDATYTCSWGSSAVQTVRFGGLATGYSTDSYTPAISFNTDNTNNIKRITGISGSLGQIFPTLSNPTVGTGQPRFSGTFNSASNMLNTNIDDPNNPGKKYALPPTLFDGVTGAPASNMFNSTFYGCSNLTGSIPENLFAGISGAPASGMFSYTFSECSNLTGSIPENLFAGISGAPASYMFDSTFLACSNLTGSIPENLFAGISGAPAEGMFNGTFYNCSNLTGSIPANLFAGVSGAPASYMFFETFSGCSSLTGSIPANLFAGVSGAPAEGMFDGTFYDCSNLTGSIPENLFAGISGAPAWEMFHSTFSGCSNLTGSIPANLFAGISGAPADGMFSGTFRGCSNLTGSIPANLFAGISGAPASLMFFETFSNCDDLTGFTDGTTTTSYVPSTFLASINTNTSVSRQAYNMFNGTGLVSTCPVETHDVTRQQFNDAGSPWCEETYDFVCESGVWFHLGNNVKTCLMSEKPESKSFAIYQNGSTYYLNMTTKEVPVNEDTATKMKVYYNGREYCLYDESVSLD